MTEIPRDAGLDDTLVLFREGYRFIPNRCRRHRSDIFETRLMLRKVFCATGAEAAEVFYHPGRFTRQGAMPPTALKLLQDKGSVELLSGDAHRHRKRMFLSLMDDEGIRRLAETFEEEWRTRIERWQSAAHIVLHDEMQATLCRAVCRWAGVPFAESEADERTREFSAMIDGAGAVGPRNWRGQRLRSQTERWGRDLINRVREGRLEAPEGSAVNVIARHRDTDGELLEIESAAVELLNVLRPTVAVARFMTFAALALHEYPECRRKLEAGDDGALERFVQEVRRFYPFFPLIGGRVGESFEWRGKRFDNGDWMLLDLYGTNHDPRAWEEPNAFRPDRFLHWNGSAYNFIPQGGGDHERTHRCPGEWATIALLKSAVRLLTTEMRYRVPPQNLTVDLTRLPAIPASRFVINDISCVGG